MAQMQRIFYPRAVAVVGASPREGSFGRLYVEGFVQMGFPRIYPVNPKGGEMLGLKIYPSLKDIHDDIDLVILATPPEAVLDLVRECTQRGVAGVIIYSSGFAEKGGEGRKIEAEMARIARQGSTRLIGPNCMGIYCPASKMTFTPRVSGGLPELPHESGPVGLICHSGSLASIMGRAAAVKGIRFSKMVSSGNECDLNAADFLEYLGQDEETRIICAYLEGIKDGRRFFRLARDISRKKPIIVWKGGATERGARAAASHTGALAGSIRVWRALVTQAGIISVNSAEELLDCILAFYRLPLPRGRRVAIVSGPGGPAVGTSDACIELGLELAELSPKTRQSIAQVIPPVGTSIDNPIDLGMGSGFAPHWYGEAIKALAQDENTDMLLVIGGNRGGLGDLVVQMTRELGKPLAMAVTRPLELAGEEYRLLLEGGVATYPDGRRAAKALAWVAQYRDYVEATKGG